MCIFAQTTHLCDGSLFADWGGQKQQHALFGLRTSQPTQDKIFEEGKLQTRGRRLMQSAVLASTATSQPILPNNK